MVKVERENMGIGIQKSPDESLAKKRRKHRKSVLTR
jgi:hypothetical protein